MQAFLLRMRNDLRSERRINSRFTEIVFLILIIMIVSSSLASEILAVGGESGKYKNASLMPSPCTMFLYFPLAAAEIILCARLFKEMHSPTQADVILSLPMTAAQRYMSKMTFFFAYVIIPYLACGILSILGAYIAELGIYKQGYRLIGIIKGFTFIFYIGLGALMFIGAICFVCSAFSTSMPEAIFTSVFSCVSLTLLPVLFYNKLIIHSAGITMTDYNSFLLNCWTLTPFYYLMERWPSDLSEVDVARTVLEVLVSIIISLIVMSLGFLAYRKRDKLSLTYSRQSRPFLFAVMITVVWTVCLYYVEGMTPYMGYAITMAAYGVFVLILNRRGFKPKTLLKWAAGFAAALAVFISVGALCYFTDGLGFSKDPRYSDDSLKYGYTVNISYPNEKDPNFWNYMSIELSGLSKDQVKEANRIIKNYRSDPKDMDSFLQFMGLARGDDYRFDEPSLGGDSYASSYFFEPAGYEYGTVYFLKDSSDPYEDRYTSDNGTEYYFLYQHQNIDREKLCAELEAVGGSFTVDILDPTEMYYDDEYEDGDEEGNYYIDEDEFPEP